VEKNGKKKIFKGIQLFVWKILQLRIMDEGRRDFHLIMFCLGQRGRKKIRISPGPL